MLKNHPSKGPSPAELSHALRECSSGPHLAQRLTQHICFALCVVYTTQTHADTIYRCGESYSTSSQCGNTTATEVKPSSVLHTTGPEKNNSVTQDLREAQSLEKQRLQAERQATQSAPIRLSMPPSAPASATSNASLTNLPKRHGKHARKANSPYFTAVDPNAASKKKSTAKAVPATSTSSP